MNREKEVQKITIIGSVINFLLLIFKLVSGIIGNSGAMIADAVHSLSDFVTDFILLIMVHISSKPKDQKHDYGHGKYETLATVLIGVLLLFIGLYILYHSIIVIYSYCFKGQLLPVPGVIAFYAAIASVVVKELLFHITKRVGIKVQSKAVIANAWHHRSDALSSVATLFGIGGAIILGQKWTILEPIATVLVSIFILGAALKLMIPALNDLLEQSLPPEVETDLLDLIKSVNNVCDPHNLKTRRIGNNIAVEVDIYVPGNVSVFESHNLTIQIESKLREAYGQGTHVVIHVEPI